MKKQLIIMTMGCFFGGRCFVSVIFFLMGKSASGKDGLGSRLLKDKALSLKPVILCTTRPMRAGEEDGREYKFCTISELEDMRREGKIIEERVYHTVQGDWYYFTPVDDDLKRSLKAGGQHFLAIGTLEAYLAYKTYFGADYVVPLYIEVRDDLRLIRAVERERGQRKPDYKELCRRFLADEDDFSREKLSVAGIERVFCNDGEIEECYEELRGYINNFI